MLNLFLECYKQKCKKFCSVKVLQTNKIIDKNKLKIKQLKNYNKYN